MSAVSPRRWQVRQSYPIAYDLLTVADVFDPDNPALLEPGRAPGRRFVVIDEHVYGHHRERIHAYFRAHRVEARIVGFPGGEDAKTVDSWLSMLTALDGFPIHRRDEPVIAIGGGVLTDVVGYAAASFRRGVPHIKVPTTLMGYVDAAVGVKTGINFNGHKNRLGSFEPPCRVLLDRGLLRTLDARHLRNGLCEILKLALIADAELFVQLEQHGADALAQRFQNPEDGIILNRAIDGMLAELVPNLREAELARSMDFGHTFSYGLETCHGDRLLHGEAVLLDMLVSTAIASRRGLLMRPEVQRILDLVAALGLAPDLQLLDANGMWQALLDRIEHRNGHQHVPLPVTIGAGCFADDVTRAEIDAAIVSLPLWMNTSHDRVAEC